MIVYDFEIFHRFDKSNSINASFRRLDYEEISSLNIKLLSTLQNKFALSFIDEISMTQSERKNFVMSFQFEAIFTFVEVVVEKTFFVSIKKQILNDFASIFQLANVAIIISKKNVKIMIESVYEKSQKSMKFLIKKLQINDI